MPENRWRLAYPQPFKFHHKRRLKKDTNDNTIPTGDTKLQNDDEAPDLSNASD